MSDPVRQQLDQLVRERGESYAGLSLLLGRNAAYIHQFMTRGTPKRLQEQDRQILARYFNIDESLLGRAPNPPCEDQDIVYVSRLSVQASAGSGNLVDREFSIGSYGFDRSWMRQVTASKAENLSIVTVAGDSMAPTLSDGDEVMIDRSFASFQIRDGIHVLRRDDALVVKRLTLEPTARTLTISSDNVAYPSYRDCPFESIEVIGRVVWVGRKIL